MNGCGEFGPLLHGFVDNELDAANVVRLENHLKQCTQCRDDLVDISRLRAVIEESDARFEAPDRLHERIAQRFNPKPSARPIAQMKRWAIPGASGALAASLALLMLLPIQTQSTVDREIVDDHVRSLLSDHLTDVRTTSQHIVRPWFNGRIDFAPRVPELAGAGFPLIGGRLDYLNGRVVPAVVYRRRLHTINLFAWPAEHSPNRTVERDGYTILEWSDGGLRYAAVSDVGKQELIQFRTAFLTKAPGE